MSYRAVNDTIKAVAEAVNPDGLFVACRTWDASLEFNDGSPQIFLYPMQASIDMTNHYYESYSVTMGFYFQDAPDSTNEQRDSIIESADVLTRIFLATLYPLDGIEITGIRAEPVFRDYAGTYSGYALSFTLGTTTNLCAITTETVVIPPVLTLCEAIQSCASNVKSIELNGNGTNELEVELLVGKEILLMATDGRIRKSGDFAFDSDTGIITFASIIQPQQTISIIYK